MSIALSKEAQKKLKLCFEDKDMSKDSMYYIIDSIKKIKNEMSKTQWNSLSWNYLSSLDCLDISRITVSLKEKDLYDLWLGMIIRYLFARDLLGSNLLEEFKPYIDRVIEMREFYQKYKERFLCSK